MKEAELIALLRAVPSHPSARNLLDDAAILPIGAHVLVLTHDQMVEGVHYLPGEAAGDVAWKLLAVNLSDLAAKGAQPLGVLLGYALGDDDWDRAFVAGLDSALTAFGVPLLGGDTVSLPAGAARLLAMTAIGQCAGTPPSRAGARAGDQLWVTGAIGDAGAGLAMLRGERPSMAELIERHRSPRPRLDAGLGLAPIVHAMMDVSDGLLIDGARMAQASGLGLVVELDLIPLSDPYLRAVGDGRADRLAASISGDDYELLFAAPPERSTELLRLAENIGLPFSRIGRFEAGSGLRLTFEGKTEPLPESLGFEHSA